MLKTKSRSRYKESGLNPKWAQSNKKKIAKVRKRMHYEAMEKFELIRDHGDGSNVQETSCHRPRACYRSVCEFQNRRGVVTASSLFVQLVFSLNETILVDSNN
ncbi:uncharacterized protein LOC143258622 [Tachypleus tridentatus]|uniref:uncharacterized protein LOC143258622 n=1 Tax=Tachypleus tridentatus TaxID=6853 RepID=UPI003FD45623